MELVAKKNLLEFLGRIEGQPDWQIYTHRGPFEFDVVIGDFIKNGKFNVAFDYSNPLTLYHTRRLQSNVRYFFCGFHANFCLFDSRLGIEKYLQLADKNKSQFWIVSDCTVGLDAKKEIDPECQTPDIPWYNIKQLDENLALTLNYRNHIIKEHSIDSNVIDCWQKLTRPVESHLG